MARYIDADKIYYTLARVYLEEDNKGRGVYRRTYVAFRSDVDDLPTAEVVPRAEVLNILSDFKKQIHDKAVYTNSQDVPNYINLKVFDAILNKYVQRCSDE